MAAGLVTTVPFQSLDKVSKDHVNTSNHLLKNTITHASHNFLRASPSLHQAALLIAKDYLDPLALSISNEQDARLQAARRKRKRGEDIGNEDILRLKQIYLQDFSTDQIWEQSKRILDVVAKEMLVVTSSESIAKIVPAKKKVVHFEKSPTSSDQEIETNKGENLEDVSVSDIENDLDEEDVHKEDFEHEELLEGSDIEVEDLDDFEDDQIDRDASKSVFTKDKHGLNDGFFSIDDFNRATEFLEQVDNRGDPDDGAASDEEDVDWAIDPMTQALTVDVKNIPRNDDDGPTFGNADLNAVWSDDEEEEEIENDDVDADDTEENNTNEIYYKDFFAPPARKLTKTKRMRALPKTQPEVEEEIQRTISAVHRDIFSDDDIEGSEQFDEQGAKNLSTHERRRKVIAQQIRQLEAEAVAKRQWTLTGEARALDRPVNSLLEDDLVLDFERTGKPVPEATVAVTEAIEDLIKSRILARNFDEIPKRIGGLTSTSSTQGKRGLLELDDRKNPQSLAEIYENEHLKSTDPNYVDSRDTETKKAHQEVERLWKEVSTKLDALSSWHYKPKPADMEVRVITDTPRVQMEDARPAGVGIGMEESGLAPQEVYRVGEELNGKKGDTNVVLTSGGALMSRGELTRDQKIRRRRREKERIKKKGSDGVISVNTAQADNPSMAVLPKRSKKSDEKKNILDELRRGNVKVIGKGGVVQDVEGRKAQLGATGQRSVGGLKL